MADFARINPASWGVNSKLTSAQINALDIDHANSLNRTGGTVTGTITVSGSGKIALATGTASTMAGNATFTLSDTATIVINGTAGLSLGSTASMLLQGTTAFAAGSTTLFSATAGLTISCTGAVISGAGAKLSTASAGRFELGDDDYPTLAAGHAGRTVTRVWNLAEPTLYGWAGATVDGPVGPATATPANLMLPSERLIHGATLAVITVQFTPTGSGGARTPANLPVATLYRRTVGATLPGWTSIGTATYIWVSAADWVNGNVKQIYITWVAPNHVIDTSAYEYKLTITDENGSGAVAGNTYHNAILSMAITDLRPA